MKVEMNFGSNFAVMSFYKYISKRLYDQSFMLCKKKKKKKIRAIDITTLSAGVKRISNKFKDLN